MFALSFVVFNLRSNDSSNHQSESAEAIEEKVTEKFISFLFLLPQIWLQKIQMDLFYFFPLYNLIIKNAFLFPCTFLLLYLSPSRSARSKSEERGKFGALETLS